MFQKSFTNSKFQHDPPLLVKESFVAVEYCIRRECKDSTKPGLLHCIHSERVPKKSYEWCLETIIKSIVLIVQVLNQLLSVVLMLWLSKERSNRRLNCATFRYHGLSVHLIISSSFCCMVTKGSTKNKTRACKHPSSKTGGMV